MKTPTKFLSVLTALSLGACAIDQVDDGTTDEDYTNEGRLAANGLTPTQLMSMGTLSSARLSTAVLNNWATTSAGKAMIPYLVGCALDSTQTVTYMAPLGTQATGLMGLATSWTTTALTTTQQELVSSCMLARLNESGNSVTISLRGDEGAYAKQSGESLSYSKQEGAWFGNIFIAAYPVMSCRGTGIAAYSRVCSFDGHCGLTWAGACADVCVFTDDHASSCTFDGTTYDNVTTVWDQ